MYKADENLLIDDMISYYGLKITCLKQNYYKKYGVSRVFK